MAPLTGTDASESVYAVARYNGVTHAAALEAVARGQFVCWCGRSERVCYGGARKLIGCPILRSSTPARRHEH